MTQRTQNESTAQELWEAYTRATAHADELTGACDAAWAAYEHAADAEITAHNDVIAALDRYLAVMEDTSVSDRPANPAD